MTKSVLTAAVVVMLSVMGCALGGCDGKPAEGPVAGESAGGEGAAGGSAEGVLASLRLAEAPGGARGVVETKNSVEDGQRVVVVGVVAGRKEPIAENRAILTLLDAGVATCDRNPADGCTTPWDACCEPAEVLGKSSVTVQVVGGDGRPVKGSLASIAGVRPLAKLIVRGVARVSADGVVLVNAEGIYVEP